MILDSSFALMQNWPDDIVYLVLVALRSETHLIDESTRGVWLSKSSGHDVFPGRGHDVLPDPDRTLSPVAHVSLRCRSLRMIAQPLLFETVHLEDTSRAERLQRLLEPNPCLLLSARHLILGQIGFKSDFHFGHNSYITFSGAKWLFSHFRGLYSLRIRALPIQDDVSMGQTCFVSLGSMHELHVDTCSFPSVTILFELIETFRELKSLILHFDTVDRTKVIGVDVDRTSEPLDHARIEHHNISRPQLISRLDYLEIRPMGYSLCFLQKLFLWLIATGRVHDLGSLHLDISCLVRGDATNELIKNAARTLTSLALNYHGDCGGFGDLVPLDLSLFLQLHHLRLQNMLPASFQKVADMLMTLAGSRCTLRIVLDLDLSHTPGVSSAEAIWNAMESVENGCHFTLSILFLTNTSEIVPTDRGVRVCVPRTDARGAVDIIIDITYLYQNIIGSDDDIVPLFD